jgi:hypothetical protein
LYTFTGAVCAVERIPVTTDVYTPCVEEEEEEEG